MQGRFAMRFEERARGLGEIGAHLPTGAFHARDAHVVVFRGLVAHPRDDRVLRALLDGDALGSGDRPAANGRRVGGDRRGERGLELGPRIGET